MVAYLWIYRNEGKDINVQIKIGHFKTCILILKSTSRNQRNSKSEYRFEKRNQNNQILKDVKAKSWKRQNLKIRHSGDILHDDWRIWKYASFEGSGIVLTPCFYRYLGLKKALLKSAIFRNSRVWKEGFLVQNVKNQFFHQLSWRGIWVV